MHTEHKHILGLAAAGGLYYKTVPLESNIALIANAVIDHGFRELDTAPWYGCGKSELDVGRALAHLAKEGPLFSSEEKYCRKIRVAQEEDEKIRSEKPFLVVNDKAALRSPPSMSGSSTINVRTLHVVSNPTKGKKVGAEAGGEKGEDDDDDEEIVNSSSLLKIGTKCGRVTIPKSIVSTLESIASRDRTAHIRDDCCAEPEKERDNETSCSRRACGGDQNLCLRYSASEKFILDHYTRDAFGQFAETASLPSSSSSSSSSPEAKALSDYVRSRAAAVAYRMKSMMAGAEAAKADVETSTGLCSGSSSPAPAPISSSEASTTVHTHETPRFWSDAAVASPMSSLTSTIPLDTSAVTGTVYLASDETADLVCVHDVTMRGVLLSFAQSYERLFGPLHAAMNERVIVDPCSCLIQIVSCDGDASGAPRPWFVIDTLRLHDADTPGRFREAIGHGIGEDEGKVEKDKLVGTVEDICDAGGLAAMKYLQQIGYVINLSLGLNDAEYALKYLQHESLVAPSSPDESSSSPSVLPQITRISCFSSVMLAGCWNLIHKDPKALPLFAFMRGLGCDQVRTVPRLFLNYAMPLPSCSLSSSSTFVYNHIELHNAGVFGVGLLWGAKVYRYAIAGEDLIQQRDRLSQQLDALLGVKVHNETEKEMHDHDVIGSKRTRDGRDALTMKYKQNPSRFNLAGAALTFAMEDTPLQGIPVRLALGCGSHVELDEAMVAWATRPPIELILDAVTTAADKCS